MAPVFAMIDEDRLYAVSDAIVEVESGMFDVAVVLGTKVSVIRNDILDELENYEAKYLELRKVLDRLDAHTQQNLPVLRLRQIPPRDTIDAYRTFREDVIRILKGKEPKR